MKRDIRQRIVQGNILIDDEEHVKLADFGLACLVDATTTASASSGGGLEGYIAPELYRKMELDHQATPYKKTHETEVFAFASVCYAVSHTALSFNVI